MLQSQRGLGTPNLRKTCIVGICPTIEAIGACTSEGSKTYYNTNSYLIIQKYIYIYMLCLQARFYFFSKSWSFGLFFLKLLPSSHLSFGPRLNISHLD